MTLRIRVCRLMLVPDASDKTTECHIRKIFHFTVVGDSLTEQPKRRYAKTQNTSQQHFFGGARYSKSAPMRPQTEGLQGPPTVCEVQGQPCEVHEPCGPTVAFTLGLLGLQIYIHTYIATAWRQNHHCNHNEHQITYTKHFVIHWSSRTSCVLHSHFFSL